MSLPAPFNFQRIAFPAAVAAAMLFAYHSVVSKLTYDWWTDDNYSHGLLVPFVIGFIIWSERDKLRAAISGDSRWLGVSTVVVALLMLAAGTVGAELFSQRISLVLMTAGIVVYFFGRQILGLLAVPVVLLLLAIPIPQIVFNRIAIPLQLWASQMAVWGIRLFDVPVLRKGNVIDIVPRGSMQTLSLEVVEACSGIRSLSTLITLALVLAYFTRSGDSKGGGLFNFRTGDLWRALLLMGFAVPIAVLTNAGRVAVTGISTFLYGQAALDGTVHEMSGWLVYVVALAILIGVNIVLKRLIRVSPETGETRPTAGHAVRRNAPLIPLIAIIVVGGIAINWFVNRGEIPVPRAELVNLPSTLGDWQQKGSDYKFDKDVESVLGATDYIMREYSLPDGRIANLYVGYYASQRTGATYHSPQNCLPGAGWVLGEPGAIEISAADGRTIKANRYIIESGTFREIMIYWYQGRGRTESSEYSDKLNTIWDSVTRRRTDGAMVRVMTGVGSDEDAAVKAAADLAFRLEDQLTPFVPD